MCIILVFCRGPIINKDSGKRLGQRLNKAYTCWIWSLGPISNAPQEDQTDTVTSAVKVISRSPGVESQTVVTSTAGVSNGLPAADRPNQITPSR